MTYLLIYFGFILAGVIWLIKSGKDAGRDEAENLAKGEVLDDIYTAKKARERLDADPDYADKLRRKYERKE